MSRLECAVAVAQQHAEYVAAVGNHEIGNAIAVDVRHRHGEGPDSVLKLCAVWKVPSPLPRNTLTVLPMLLLVTRSGLPSPLTSATATRVRPSVRSEVVRTGTCHRHCPTARSHCCCCIGRDQVGLAVAVESATATAKGSVPSGDVLCGLEGAVAIAQ